VDAGSEEADKDGEDVESGARVDSDPTQREECGGARGKSEDVDGARVPVRDVVGQDSAEKPGRVDDEEEGRGFLYGEADDLAGKETDVEEDKVDLWRGARGVACQRVSAVSWAAMPNDDETRPRTPR
jgi:hypothetical protein